MSFTKTFISVFFLLLSTSLFAAKPEKELVCHVGSQLGSNGESYQENPNCDILPPYVGDAADYICPDAGKIDLILVSERANHLGNEAHAFDGLSDYEPFKENAGSDPNDFEDINGPDGIDDGCELEELLTCPCWAGQTLSETVTQLDAWFAADAALGLSSQSCSLNPFDHHIVWFTDPSVAVVRLLAGGNADKGFSCTFQRAGMSAAPDDEFHVQFGGLESPACSSELAAIQELAAVCP